VRKIGLAPVQRDGLEYEFDVVALINAGALRPGTLESGDIERNDLVKLLAFGEDKIVSVVITGAQLHAALERAASVYPTASPAFLQVAGLTATFNPDSAVGSRVSRIKVGASALSDTKTYRAAMPVSLAQGAAGYFNIWNGAQSSPTDVQLIDAVGGYIRGQKEVTPESQTRFGPA
jgi:2',3'-cyclic-nucleotide 2'-phosphodiesterase (5'-nucleotidase family)